MNHAVVPHRSLRLNDTRRTTCSNAIGRSPINRPTHPKNANHPRESSGLGDSLEEEVVAPYLQDIVVGKEAYVQNSMWNDDTVETPGGDLSDLLNELHPDESE